MTAPADEMPKEIEEAIRRFWEGTRAGESALRSAILAALREAEERGRALASPASPVAETDTPSQCKNGHGDVRAGSTGIHCGICGADLTPPSDASASAKENG